MLHNIPAHTGCEAHHTINDNTSNEWQQGVGKTMAIKECL